MRDETGIVSVVDDEPSIRRAVSNLLRSVGLEVRAFASAQEYLTTGRPEGPTCLVLDVDLPGVSGLDLQAELARAEPPPPIVFLTGHGDIPMTVRALKAGAVDFLTKPVDQQALLQAVRQGLTRSQPQGSVDRNGAGFDAIAGRAPAFLAAIADARKVAPTRTTVLLTGESGTGKEVLARAIHEASARAAGPFIALNCAALPETLVESELFGHERGAFTGADRLKRGRFELAAGGTLFLDEVGELAPAAQAKLLRVLQERRYERVGGTTTLEADVRVIAATNRDLAGAVADGRFREDLYYRLAVFRVHLPALRERDDDVLLLADHFVRHIGARLGRPEANLSGAARDLLRAYAWPGNIRELQNAIERALIRAQGGPISAEHLGIVPRVPCDAASPAAAARALEPKTIGVHGLVELEKQMILDALHRANGNKSRAAAAFGVSRTRFHRRLRHFGLDD
jgi:two-component system response regulator HydG